MKRYYIKHEDLYFVNADYGSFEWSRSRDSAKIFQFLDDAKKYSAGLRSVTRGLGSKARVISVGA